MILIICAFLAAGALFMFMYFSTNSDDILGFTVFCLLALLTPAIIIFGGVWLNNDMCTKVEIVERIEIYAGYNDNEIRGRLFLLSGHIDEKDVVYYWVDDNGVKPKHSQPMDNSVFIEDGGEYLLLRHRTCPENLRWLFVCDAVTIEFHVPENSIRQMYQYQ
jgi:hypothetical protein